MPSFLYDSFKYENATGLIDLDGDIFYMMLVGAGYAPNAKTHSRRSHVTNEVVGAGYVAGGKALTGVTATNDTVNDRLVFTSDPPSWPASTITARYAVIYKSTGNAATDNLVCCLDFGVPKASDGGAFDVAMPAPGWFYNG